jgi:hypothetical protein
VEPRHRRLICGIFVAAASVCGQSLAHAHSWYEDQCCQSEHCEAVADGTVLETLKGFTVPSGELLP